MPHFCRCWPKTEIKSPIPQQDEDDAYGTIDNSSERKPAVSFRTRTKPEVSDDRRSTPVVSNGNVHNASPSRRSISFGFNFRKNKSKQSAPNRELPKLPKKAFNRSNIPSIDDPTNPTYESIDVENDSISDPLYSKVDENPASQRYDYPMFRNKQGKKKHVDEPLYTSASQIYSGGSEDPYSSIVSDAPGPSTSRRNRQEYDDGNSIYDPGYARVKDPSSQKQNSRETPADIDQLYAKINRPSMRRIRALQEESSSTDPGPSSVRRPVTVSFAQDQTNESGSGSIISGSSANPSYRYLTVRETVDVVRERLRQRQNQSTDQTDESGNGPIREHYYSTIANEYESVGGGSLNGSIYGAAIPVVNAADRTVSPLTLNVARLSGVFEGTPPRPPTSPIPNRLSNQRTQVTSPTRLMSTSLTNASRIVPGSEDRSTSNPNLARPVILNGASLNTSMPPIPAFLNSWHSQTAASVLSDRNLFPRGQPRVIPPISTTSTSFSISQKRDNTIEAKRSIGTHTPTKDLVDSETQTNLASKIPVLNTRLHRQRSQSPVVDSGTQTNGISSDQEQKRSKMNISMRSQSPNPLPTGKDYISPVDLSNQRAWPLENNNEKKPSGSSEN